MNKVEQLPKLRKSKQREKIYSYLCGTKSHPSAEMIYEHLKDELDNLSLGTVYRNLVLLEKLGKIICVANTDGTQRFDADCSIHAHFVCRECDEVLDLQEIDAEQVKKLCAISNEVIERISVVLHGLCPKCAAKGLTTLKDNE